MLQTNHKSFVLGKEKESKKQERKVEVVSTTFSPALEAQLSL
jgi:hypothetical protein